MDQTESVALDDRIRPSVSILLMCIPILCLVASSCQYTASGSTSWRSPEFVEGVMKKPSYFWGKGNSIVSTMKVVDEIVWVTTTTSTGQPDFRTYQTTYRCLLSSFSPGVQNSLRAGENPWYTSPPANPTR